MPTDASGASKQGYVSRVERIAYGSLLVALAAQTVSIALFEIAACALMASALWTAVRERRAGEVLRSRVTVAAVLFVAAHVLSFFRTDYPYASFRGVLKAAENVGVFLAAAFVVNSPKRLRGVVTVSLIVAGILFVDAIVQGWLGRDLLRWREMTAYSGELKRLTGPFKHANDFSAYLTYTVIFLAGLLLGSKPHAGIRERGGLLIGVCAALYCLFATFSRGAWLATAAGLFFLTILRKSRLLLAALVLLAGFSIFAAPQSVRERLRSLADPANGTILERRALWGESLGMIRESPWIGLGANTYAKNEPRYKTGHPGIDNQYAHNGYLQMTAEIGLIGLAAFLGTLALFFTQTLGALRRARDAFVRRAGTAISAGLFGFLLHSATDTNLHSLLLVNGMWLAMGVVYGIARRLE